MKHDIKVFSTATGANNHEQHGLPHVFPHQDTRADDEDAWDDSSSSSSSSDTEQEDKPEPAEAAPVVEIPPTKPLPLPSPAVPKETPPMETAEPIPSEKTGQGSGLRQVQQMFTFLLMHLQTSDL